MKILVTSLLLMFVTSSSGAICDWRGSTDSVTLSECSQAEVDAFKAGNPNTDLIFKAELPIEGGLGSTIEELALRPRAGSSADTTLFEIVHDYVGGQNLIRIAKPFDRDGSTASTLDDKDVMQFDLICKPYAFTGVNQREKPFTVNVEDVNDNTPTFSQSVYTTDLNELTPIFADGYYDKFKAGETYFPIAATDLDFGADNGKISYSFLPTPGKDPLIDGTSYFRMPLESSVDIKIKNPIDYEALPPNKTLYLTIQAKDAGIKFKRSSTTLVVFKITDGNDLPVTFTYPSCTLVSAGYVTFCLDPTYTATYDGQTLGPLTPVEGAVSAKDMDSLNLPVRYSILSQSIPAGLENSYFSINPTTGVVSVLQDISPFRITYPVIRFHIRADEVGGKYWGTATYVIKNANTNGNTSLLTTSTGATTGYTQEISVTGSFTTPLCAASIASSTSGCIIYCTIQCILHWILHFSHW